MTRPATLAGLTADDPGAVAPKHIEKEGGNGDEQHAPLHSHSSKLAHWSSGCQAWREERKAVKLSSRRRLHFLLYAVAPHFSILAIHGIRQSGVPHSDRPTVGSVVRVVYDAGGFGRIESGAHHAVWRLSAVDLRQLHVSRLGNAARDSESLCLALRRSARTCRATQSAVHPSNLRVGSILVIRKQPLENQWHSIEPR